MDDGVHGKLCFVWKYESDVGKMGMVQVQYVCERVCNVKELP